MILAKVWLDRESLREQLKDCSAVVDRQQQQLDRNAEQIAALRQQLAEKEDTGTPHYVNCFGSGPKHYVCALMEITDLRNRLQTETQLLLDGNKIASKCHKEEVATLHQCLRNVYEVWAGSEGIPAPTVASEAYLLSLVEQMRDAAKEGLK